MTHPPLIGRTGNRSRSRRQRGMALIIVLAFVAMFGVLALMSSSTARTASHSSHIVVKRARARYAAESAAAEAMWLVYCDRQRFRNRRLGLPDVERDYLGDDEIMKPWMADGYPHRLNLGDDLAAVVRVLDANRGWDLSGTRPSSKIRGEPAFQTNPDDPDAEADLQIIQEFFDTLDDYVDQDDAVRTNGWERDDYESELGLLQFPRNRPLQFREEAYWIRHIDRFLPELAESSFNGVLPDDAIRLIPPKGSRSVRKKPSFFSSSPEMISATTGLSGEELQLVLEARDRWYLEAVPIQEGLGELYQAVAGKMEMMESGVVTIDVTAGEPGSGVTRRLVLTVDLLRPPTAGEPPAWPLWQRILY